MSENVALLTSNTSQGPHLVCVQYPRTAKALVNLHFPLALGKERTIVCLSLHMNAMYSILSTLAGSVEELCPSKQFNFLRFFSCYLEHKQPWVSLVSLTLKRLLTAYLISIIL